MNLLFDDLKPKKRKRAPLPDTEWVKAQRHAQAQIVLAAVKELFDEPGAGVYLERVHKRVNQKGQDFEKHHVRASLKYLTDMQFVKRVVEDRTAYYEPYASS